MLYTVLKGRHEYICQVLPEGGVRCGYCEKAGTIEPRNGATCRDCYAVMTVTKDGDELLFLDEARGGSIRNIKLLLLED